MLVRLEVISDLFLLGSVEVMRMVFDLSELRLILSWFIIFINVFDVMILSLLCMM